MSTHIYIYLIVFYVISLAYHFLAYSQMPSLHYMRMIISHCAMFLQRLLSMITFKD